VRLSKEKIEGIWVNAVDNHQIGRYADAEKMYKFLLTQCDENEERWIDAAINLGAMLRTIGRTHEAKKHYSAHLKKHPDNITLRLNYVNCLNEMGLHEESLLMLKDIDTAIKRDKRIRHILGKTLMASGNNQEAIKVFESILSQGVMEMDILLDTGLAYYNLGMKEKALEKFNTGERLQLADEKIAGNKITVLTELGRSKEAYEYIRGMDKSLRNSVAIRSAIAVLEMSQRRMREAEEILEELCQEVPDEAINWLNRAACLRSLKLYNKAHSVIKKGVLKNPKNERLYEALGQSLAELGQPEKGIKVLLAMVKGRQDISWVSLLNLQFLGSGYRLIEPKELAQMSKAWENCCVQNTVTNIYLDSVRGERGKTRIKVAYMSCDFCDHPVGRYIHPIIESHNKDLFEIWVIDSGSREDNLNKLIRKSCDRYLNIAHMDDVHAARIMADCKLDIIVELGGFTGGSRLSVLVHRPCRRQISYLGYFSPTYLNCIDAWIGDEALFGGLDKVEKAAHRRLLIKGGYMAFSGDNFPRAESESGDILAFGCFNHSRKLTMGAIRLFSNVLKTIENSRLVLKSVSFVEDEERRRIEELFAYQGIESGKLVTIPWMQNRHQHLECYNKLDLALDPIPYGGATTTCEALFMGVPVITLEGEGMVGRLSSSILHSCDKHQWVADNEYSFIRIVRQLADQGKRTTRQRRELQDEVKKSALGDTMRLTNELEKHYTLLASDTEL